MISELTGSSSREVAALAGILSASISYLAMLEEQVPAYNGLNLQNDTGWQQLSEGMDVIIDLWTKNTKK